MPVPVSERNNTQYFFICQKQQSAKALSSVSRQQTAGCTALRLRAHATLHMFPPRVVFGTTLLPLLHPLPLLRVFLSCSLSACLIPPHLQRALLTCAAPCRQLVSPDVGCGGVSPPRPGARSSSLACTALCRLLVQALLVPPGVPGCGGRALLILTHNLEGTTVLNGPPCSAGPVGGTSRQAQAPPAYGSRSGSGSAHAAE